MRIGELIWPEDINRLSEIDSIEELARFWDTHDITDFEEDLEEVEEHDR